MLREEANLAKPLSANARWAAACIQARGGFGFAGKYDAEGKFREALLCQVAPESDPFSFPDRQLAAARSQPFEALKIRRIPDRRKPV